MQNDLIAQNQLTPQNYLWMALNCSFIIPILRPIVNVYKRIMDDLQGKNREVSPELKSLLSELKETEIEKIDLRNLEVIKNPSNNSNLFSSIPEEITMLILSYLKPQEILNISLVGHYFDKICHQPQIIHGVLEKSNFEVKKHLQLAEIVHNKLRKINLTNQKKQRISQEDYVKFFNICSSIIKLKISCEFLNTNALKLPNCLESLTLRNGYDGFKKCFLLPQSLQVLKIKSWDILKSKELKNLPPHLKALTLDIDKGLTSDLFSFLPEELEELTLVGTHQTLIDFDYKLLPKNLKRLQLFKSNITDEQLSELPKAINTLKLHHCNQVTDQGIQNLPNLETLTLISCEKITFDLISFLPSSLKYLEIRDCRKDQPSDNLSPVISFSHLSALTTLITDFNRFKILQPGLMGDNFNDLPEGLKTLSLYDCQGLTNVDLINFPDSITSLSLHNGVGFSNALAGFIPNDLTFLSLVNCVGITIGDTGINTILPKWVLLKFK